MEPLFSKKQLQEMSKENMITLLTTMQAHQQKQETKIQLLTEKVKDPAAVAKCACKHARLARCSRE